MMNKKCNIGFTLTELMVVIAIVGILASMAVPSFQATIETNRLKEAVESLKSDLMFARTEAIKRSTNLNISILVNGSSWCYGIDDDNTACACATVGSCAIKTVDGSQYQGTTLDADDNVVFSFRRGTASEIGSNISTANYTARVKVSNRGRVTICSSDLGGYDAC